MDIGIATESDEAAVIALWRRCGLAERDDHAGEDIRRAIEAVSSDVLLGRIDGEIRATVLIGYDGHRAWAYYVAVEPRMQGTGLGRRMMAAAAAWARERGAPKLMLLVADDNREVLGFYKALGFEPRPFAPLAMAL